MTQLVVGVGGLNLLFLCVGYCLLAAPLARESLAGLVSWCGVALLAGAGAVGVAVFLATIGGAEASPVTLAACAALLAAAGLAARVLRPARSPLGGPARPRDPVLPSPTAIASTVAAFGVAAIAAFGLVGGFRSSPWLDDSWGIWLPKGLALAKVGLDSRLFSPTSGYVHFEVLDYPLWWSVVTALDVRFAGSLDVRAIDAELAILAVAFLAAAARMLSGHARPWLLWAGLLLLAASPAFFHHAQSGMADLPLAMYLGLWLLAALGWLATGRAFQLAVAGIAAAAAFALKTEGLPELALFLAVLTVAAWRPARSRLLGVWLATAAAFLTYVPWLAWRSAHDVGSRVGLAQALGPGYLSDRAGRIGPSVRTVARHVFDPTDWTVIVALLVLLGLAGALRERRLLWLAPSLLVGGGILFWAWAYWAAKDDLGYVLATSSYRVIDPLVVAADVLLPLEAERLLRVFGR